MTLIASSTRTGVLDMTRTTGMSPPSRRSISDVVMPAATEITRPSAGTCGAISSSSAAMSWGLTARMSVSALFAASAALTTPIP